MGLALANETRIVVLLVIDVVFFFIEILSGYAVGSLALVADSFHMLNDVMSLIVALYAVRLANDKDRARNPRYSYGWQRAEILGALFNGVFLLALCFSIFMEALERLVSKPNVSNPLLVIVVGSLGLLSNIVGLFLFHGHSHGHSHEHDHSHDIESGHEHAHGHSADPAAAAAADEEEDDDDDGDARRRSVGGIVGHPAQARAFVMEKAQRMGYDSPSKATSASSPERQALLAGDRERSRGYGAADAHHGHDHGHEHEHEHRDVPRATTPSEARAAAAVREHRQSIGSSAHSHGGNMNMTGVFLHVLGDAIGNVGVIFTGMFIFYTSYSWRSYADPIISFIISFIIFNSALPLVKSASFILLQGVPASVSLDGVRETVYKIEGVINVHDLHIWQLNENKIVASVHILVDCSAEQTQRYMQIANEVRRALHIWGIHSSTIQPEFVAGGIKEVARLSGMDPQELNSDDQGRLRTRNGNLVEAELSQRDQTCLLACDVNECGENTCCSINAPVSNDTHGEEGNHANDASGSRR